VWHRGGSSVETLLRRYPNLGPARLLDALSFAYDNQDLIEADIAREQALFEKQGGPSVGARPLAQLSLPFDGEEEEEDDARPIEEAQSKPEPKPAPTTRAEAGKPAPATRAEAGKPARKR
jgi:hypothetical protein